MVATIEKKPYKGIPKDAIRNPDGPIIFHLGSDGPFVQEIRHIEEQAQEIRTAISRYLDTWAAVFSEAHNARDTIMAERAQLELTGLYALLARLSKAVS